MLDPNKRKGDIGVETVIRHLTAQGYLCQDVSKQGRRYGGFDVLAKKEGRTIRVEVKSSQSEHGIPDFYSGEFDDNLGLVADFIYIVRLDEDYRPRSIDVLSKEEVDRYSGSHQVIRRVKTAELQRALTKGVVGRSVSAPKTGQNPSSNTP
jgi:hypothetical protein